MRRIAVLLCACIALLFAQGCSSSPDKATPSSIPLAPLASGAPPVGSGPSATPSQRPSTTASPAPEPSIVPDSSIRFLGVVGVTGVDAQNLYVVGIDGTGLRKPTDNRDLAARFWGVWWSPDGSRILFEKEDVSGTALYIMNADGTDLQQLFASEAAPGFGAEWSPDSRHIVFWGTPNDSDQSAKLYLMQSDGKDLRRLTTQSRDADETWPDWSPAGDQVVFGMPFGMPRGTEPQICIAQLDGVELACQRVAADEIGPPKWSPDGNWIIYLVRSNTGDFHQFSTGFRLLSADLSQSSEVKAPSGVIFGSLPIWSPDGSQVAFSMTQQSRDGETVMVNLAVLNLQTLKWHEVISEGIYSLCWLPDGERLAYTHVVSPSYDPELWIVNADGSGARRVAEHFSLQDCFPSR